MTRAYLVEGHLGGLYVSTRSPADITAYCDQCGDSDRIAASWQEGDLDAEGEAIATYFVEHWNEQPATPWEVVRYWFSYQPEELARDKEDAFRAIADFDGYSCAGAKARAISLAEQMWKPASDAFEPWGIEPFDRERLVEALVAGAEEEFFGKIHKMDAQAFFADEARYDRRSDIRRWESELEGGESACVEALERLLPGYKALYEAEYGIEL